MISERSAFRGRGGNTDVHSPRGDIDVEVVPMVRLMFLTHIPLRGIGGDGG